MAFSIQLLKGGIFVKKALVVLLLVGLVVTLGLSKTTVQFWHAMGGWRIDLLNDMASQFMELYPDIEVEVQYTGSYQETLNKLITSVQSGTAPHVIQVFEIGTQKLIDGQVALPIQDLIDEDTEFDIGNFLPQVLNYYRVDGKLYSMPFNSSNPVLYYNKTMFAEAGLDPNKPPRTFQELIEMSRALSKKDSNGNIIQAGITWNLHSWFLEEYNALQSALMVNNNNGRTGRATEAIFNNEASLRFLKLWNDMSKEGLMLNTKREDWTAARQMFMSQKVAMLISSTSDVAIMVDAQTNGFEASTAFLPRPEGAPAGGVAIGGGSLWLIDGHSKAETNAAWTFMKWMADTDQQVRWHFETGYFPVRKDSLEVLMNSGMYAEEPALLGSIFQLLLSEQNYASNGAVIGAYPEMRNIIETAIERMLNGEMTPEQALAWAEKESTIAIQEYNELYQ